jgi:predicted nucleic acid-binding protein
MVLVDTSVWVRFLAGRSPYAAELDRLLGLEEVTGHELVYGELLIGDRGGRRKLLAAYQRMHQAAMVPHRDVVAFVRDRDLHGRGLGWIGIHLLASAIVAGLQLWTADPHFSAVANQFGVAYEAPASSTYAIRRSSAGRESEETTQNLGLR